MYENIWGRTNSVAINHKLISHMHATNNSRHSQCHRLKITKKVLQILYQEQQMYFEISHFWENRNQLA